MTVHGGPKVVDNNLISCSDPASRNSYYTGDDNVSLLLNFDGPNGSRDFVDSSKYNHVITANGDVKISTAQSKFGGSSAAFDGSGDYLTVPNNAAFQFGGGDFTIEAYIYLNAGSAIQRIYSHLQDGNNQAFFSVTASNKLSFETYFSPTSRAITSSSSVPIGEWFHAAASRSGTTWRVFINGTKEGEQTYSFTIPELTADIFISTWNGSSQPLNGYIDGIKITKGQALYTSNFTPPTAPFKSSNIVYNLTPNVESSNNNVSLLLNFDGPNGSTNFVDSSNYNHTITANGNAQISTTQSKFGGSSAYFDGTGDYLIATDSESFAMGSGDFTIEMWLYHEGSLTDVDTFYENRASPSSGTGFQIRENNAGYAVRDGASTLISTTSGRVINQWQHFALIRSNGTLSMFIDGVKSGTSITYTTNHVDQKLRLGSEFDGSNAFNGYIDDLIITKGVAKYTNNFQVPSSPATRVPMESLRLRFDGENGSTTFRDLSPYSHLVTINGNTQISTSQSKSGASSLYIEDNIYFSNSSPAFGFSSGDFTVAFWYYHLGGTFDSDGRYISFGANSGNLNITQKGGIGLVNEAVAHLITNTNIYPDINTWTHIALTRYNGTCRLFKNGIQFASINSSVGNISGTCSIDSVASGFGYIDDVIVIKGKALYTSNFTPPTAPVEPYLSSSLLLNFNGENGSTTFTDESPYAHTITANGNAQISTAQSKFGGSSAYFDGAGDYLSVPSNAAFDFGTGDFTIEAWIHPTATTGLDKCIWDTRDLGNDSGLVLFINATGLLSVYTSGSIRITSLTAVSANAWQHVALVRQSGVLAFYVDGTQDGTASYASAITCPTVAVIANREDFNRGFPGYIDSLRIVKGRALYTGNFTPPQKQQKLITNKDVRNISLYDDVSLQLNFDGANGSTTFVDSSFNNHTITVNGNAQISTTQSKFGGASAAFDGTGDWVTTAVSNELAFETGAFTVECWIYWDGTVTGTPYMGVLGVHNSSGTGRYAIFMTSSGIGHYIQTAFPAMSAFSANQWTHIASTRDDAGVCRFFIDGVLKTTVTDSGNLTAPQGFRVGNDFSSGRPPFSGHIDDLRIIKGRALYTKNFTPPTRALRNSTIYESSNKGIISCDHNNYLEIEQILNPISIDFWFKTFNTDDAAIIYAGDDSYDSTQWQWALYYYNDTLYYQPSSQSSEAIEISSVSIDTWYNIVLTRGTSGKVYINGVLVDSNSCSDSLVAGHTRIGKSGNNYWNGIFGPLKMYDYELSSSEARDNFNALKGRFGL